MESMSVQEHVLMQVRHEARRAEYKAIQELSKVEFDLYIFEKWTAYKESVNCPEDYITHVEFYDEHVEYYKR